MFDFISPKALEKHGILGINNRNSSYIMRYNKRSKYPLVDDKLQTKKLALSAGIAVPKLYSIIEIHRQRNELDNLLQKYTDVVIKPAHGSGGNGILVIVDKVGDRYKISNGELISLNAIKHYVSNILSGMYSIGGIPDQAFLEYRVQFDPVFNQVIFRGVPDIRLIVFKGVPISAMIRLPTRKSNGKANLHQGAIGVGIDIQTGITGTGVSGNTIVKTHPDTGFNLAGLGIPKWEEILNIAVKCADTVNLGYLGVDIVLDEHLGPLMLELNARPGLNVQLANQNGLLRRLKTIEELNEIPDSIMDRLEISKSLKR